MSYSYTASCCDPVVISEVKSHFHTGSTRVANGNIGNPTQSTNNLVP